MRPWNQPTTSPRATAAAVSSAQARFVVDVFDGAALGQHFGGALLQAGCQSARW
jgi:hypothetical protein